MKPGFRNGDTTFFKPQETDWLTLTPLEYCTGIRNHVWLAGIQILPTKTCMRIDLQKVMPSYSLLQHMGLSCNKNVVWLSQEVSTSLLLLPVNIHCTYVISLSFEDILVFIHRIIHYYCNAIISQWDREETTVQWWKVINAVDESEITDTYRPSQETDYFCFQWSVLWVRLKESTASSSMPLSSHPILMFLTKFMWIITIHNTTLIIEHTRYTRW